MIVSKVLINHTDNSKTPAIFVHDGHLKIRIFIDKDGHIFHDITNYTYCDEPEIRYNL